MSQENVEVVRSLYAAAARRDTGAVLSIYAPGCRMGWLSESLGRGVHR